MKAIVMLALLLAGCGGSSEHPVPAETVIAPVADHTSVYAKPGLTGSHVVPNHLLGVAKMPGGSLGDYSVKGKKYQLFVIDARTNQKAAFLLLDLKATLRTPDYLAHMGGYAGSDGTRDIYVFAKNQYLAGVVGLSRPEAEPIAITLAARLK